MSDFASQNHPKGAGQKWTEQKMSSKSIPIFTGMDRNKLGVGEWKESFVNKYCFFHIVKVDKIEPNSYLWPKTLQLSFFISH